MPGNIRDAVREICLAFPEAQEMTSHGAPTFKAAGKSFARLSVNHHGDGRVALWVASPAGVQDHRVEVDPDHFFVPPYVGPSGWLGIHLDRGLGWDVIADLTREAYLNVAPRRIGPDLVPVVRIAPPDEALDPVETDPWSVEPGRSLLARLRDFCLALPETSEGDRFGSPAFLAGKKVFCTAHRGDGRYAISMWVGGEMQSMLADDPRYRVPMYTGKNGWILFEAESPDDWDEARDRITASYRRFALKRMLKQIDRAS